MRTRKTERIDVAPFAVKPMSHNIPGHEDRMVSHCKRVQREYLDLREIGRKRNGS